MAQRDRDGLRGHRFRSSRRNADLQEEFVEHRRQPSLIAVQRDARRTGDDRGLPKREGLVSEVGQCQSVDRPYPLGRLRQRRFSKFCVEQHCRESVVWLALRELRAARVRMRDRRERDRRWKVQLGSDPQLIGQERVVGEFRYEPFEGSSRE